MKLKSILPCILFLITACSGDRSFQFDNLKKSPEEIASLIISDLLSRSDFMLYQTPGVSALHYAEVCTAYGAIKIAGKLKYIQVLNNLIARYDNATTEYIPNTANHVDANAYGILPLEIYIQTKDQKYLNQGIIFADGQWKEPLSGGLSSQTRYWIDDIYMIGCLQVQAYRATCKMIYLERAAAEINSYIEKLQQENGLFYHGENAPFFWARGNGWVAAGLAELLSVLPEDNPCYNSILDGYKKMMKTLIDNQSEDGMWHQVIDKPESFKETSSTAMFGFAITLGVKKGLLPEEHYTASCIKAWNALVEYLGEDGKIGEVCVGTGQSKDINYYFNRPRIVGDLHGQAPMLWFAGALISDKF